MILNLFDSANEKSDSRRYATRAWSRKMRWNDFFFHILGRRILSNFFCTLWSWTFLIWNYFNILGTWKRYWGKMRGDIFGYFLKHASGFWAFIFRVIDKWKMRIRLNLKLFNPIKSNKMPYKSKLDILLKKVHLNISFWISS